jgi:hypothetical protein
MHNIMNVKRYRFWKGTRIIFSQTRPFFCFCDGRLIRILSLSKGQEKAGLESQQRLFIELNCEKAINTFMASPILPPSGKRYLRYLPTAATYRLIVDQKACMSTQ